MKELVTYPTEERREILKYLIELKQPNTLDSLKELINEVYCGKIEWKGKSFNELRNLIEVRGLNTGQSHDCVKIQRVVFRGYYQGVKVLVNGRQLNDRGKVYWISDFNK